MIFFNSMDLLPEGTNVNHNRGGIVNQEKHKQMKRISANLLDKFRIDISGYPSWLVVVIFLIFSITAILIVYLMVRH